MKNTVSKTVTSKFKVVNGYKTIPIVNPEKVRGLKFMVINNTNSHNYPLNKVLTFAANFTRTAMGTRRYGYNVAKEVRDGNHIYADSCVLVIGKDTTPKKVVKVVKSDFSAKDEKVLRDYFFDHLEDEETLPTKKNVIAEIIEDIAGDFNTSCVMSNIENTCSMMELSMDSFLATLEDGVNYNALSKLSKELRDEIKLGVHKQALKMVLDESDCILANVNAGECERILIASGLFKKVHTYKQGSVRVYVNIK